MGRAIVGVLWRPQSAPRDREMKIQEWRPRATEGFTKSRWSRSSGRSMPSRSPEVAKKHGVSAQTISGWRKHVGTLEPADVKRRRARPVAPPRVRLALRGPVGRGLRFDADRARCRVVPPMRTLAA